MRIDAASGLGKSMVAEGGRQRRRLRIVAAMALLGLAGCAANSRAPQPDAAHVEIEPQGAVKPAQAQRLATMLAGEAHRRNLLRPDEKLNGVIDAAPAGDGLYLVTVLDLSGAKGKRLHRIVEESLNPQQTLTDADLKNTAASAIDKLALWRGTDDDIATGGIAPARAIASSAALDIAPFGPDEKIAAASIATIAAARPDFDIVFGPAPGDGAAALKAALESELAKMPPIGDARHYSLHGDVAISSRDDGDVGVAIHWQLASADGRRIGMVTQSRAVSPSRIASYWGDLARTAATPAAISILDMLNPASSPMLPGNAS